MPTTKMLRLTVVQDGKAFDVCQWTMRFTMEYLLEGMMGMKGGVCV